MEKTYRHFDVLGAHCFVRVAATTCARWKMKVMGNHEVGQEKEHKHRDKETATGKSDWDWCLPNKPRPADTHKAAPAPQRQTTAKAHKPT